MAVAGNKEEAEVVAVVGRRTGRIDNMKDFISNSRTRSERLNEFKDIMRCDKCGQETMVCDSRMIGGVRRRRKICNVCGNRTTTYEISREDFEMLLAKENEHDGE